MINAYFYIFVANSLFDFAQSSSCDDYIAI